MSHSILLSNDFLVLLSSCRDHHALKLECQLEQARQDPTTIITDEPKSYRGGVSFFKGRVFFPSTPEERMLKTIHRHQIVKAQVDWKAPILALESLNQVQRAAQQHPGLLTNSALVKCQSFSEQAEGRAV
eukprot:5068234-Amphidinium_carterae.1